MAIDNSIFNEQQATALAAGAFDTIDRALPLYAFLPDTHVPGIAVSWVPNERLQQDMASFAAFGANAPYDRKPGSGAAYSLNLQPVRIRHRIDEQDIITNGGATNQFLHDQLQNSFQALGNQIAYRLEAARLSMLLDGKITLNENGDNGVYDFQRDATLQDVTPSSRWTTASADPVKDVKHFEDLIEAKDGILPSTMVVSRQVMDDLAGNKNVINYAAVTEPDVSRPTASYAGVRTAFANYSDIKNIIVLDDAYRDFADQRQIILPFDVNNILGNRVLFLPSGPVGETALGPQAETVGSGSVQSVYAHVERPDSNQPSYEAYVTATAMPILSEANSTLVAKVA